ncbi:MAG: FMN-binding protein, partial [Ruminococcus sp.]|nr:FMN-binding protein [Ruminococcus sp.]
NIASIIIFLSALSGVLVSCSKEKPEKTSDSGITNSISSTTSILSDSISATTSSAGTSTATITTTVQTVSATDIVTSDTTTTDNTTTKTAETSGTEESSETTETTVTETEIIEEVTEDDVQNDYTEQQEEETPQHEESYTEINEQPEQREEPKEPEIPAETEPSYIYRNGTYSASAYGYDGDVYVDITVENDVITAIHARTEESDEWYFNSAQESVISSILSSQSTSVDAVSGATYSSKAIMEAVKKALDSAKN